MKSFLRQLFLGAAVALFVGFTPVTVAQEPAAPPEGKSPDQNQPVGNAAPPALRRIDPPADESSNGGRSRSEITGVRAGQGREVIRERVAQARLRATERDAKRTGRKIVNVFGDSSLPEGEMADEVAAVFGSSTSEGEVVGSVVSVFGDTRVTGRVGKAAIAVCGNVYVNSRVRDVIAVLGDVELGPDAEVDADVVCVGGTVKKDPKAVLHRSVRNISFGHLFNGANGLKAWIYQCLFLGRPLGFGPHLAWAWGVAGAFLALYIFLALLFRDGVEKCEMTLVTRPGYSVLAALFATLLAPIVMVLLVMTGIGIAVVPFIAAGLLFATLFGKAVLLAWLGRKFIRFFGDGPLAHPAFAVLVAGVLVAGLYTVPVLGFTIYKLLAWLGMGVVVYTLVLGLKRENRVTSPPSIPDAAVAAEGVGVMAGAPAAGSTHVPPLISAATLPRAGFWIRVAALLLDAILVGIIAALLRYHGPTLLLILAVYGAVMWKLKGTTIGGIVCGLKVVRIDDREIDWATAIVRALGCFLSLAVVGLGFIWVAIDDDKQSWHDKIAGTTVVRVPKGMSLL